MSLQIYENEMIQLFEMKKNKFQIGNVESILRDIENNALSISLFEEMFNIMVMNKEKIREGDYRQMYDLFRRFDTISMSM